MSNKNVKPPPNLMEMAQQIAKDFPVEDGENIDMNNMVKHVTESVMNMVGKGDVDLNSMTASLMQGFMQQEGGNGGFDISQLAGLAGLAGLAAGGNMPSKDVGRASVESNKNSKINLSTVENIETTQEAPVEHPSKDTSKKFKNPDKDKKYYEEIEGDDDDDDEDVFQPRTKDIEINLNVSLDDFFNGTKKKLAVRRKRLKKNADGEMVQYEEKKKIVIPIIPGMRDEQELRFNKEADEEKGYETGDIVITLYENAHSVFEREGDNLFIIKNISLYEAFAASCGEDVELTIPHLDGSILKLKTDGLPLHNNNDGMRKIIGQGMPKYKKDDSQRGDLFVRFNLTLPKKFNKDDMKILKKLFPSQNEELVKKGKTVREVKLENVSDEDLEELKYGYSDDSDSDDDSESSEEDYRGRKR